AMRKAAREDPKTAKAKQPVRGFFLGDMHSEPQDQLRNDQQQGTKSRELAALSGFAIKATMPVGGRQASNEGS
ncbi:hypothetical protein BGX34_006193, partial [Mortierella sp. NVP85]